MFDHSQEVSASITPSQIPSIHTPIELYDALSGDLDALRAMGELLRTARLSEFDRGEFSTAFSADKMAEGLQCGLSRLITLCLESQQRILDNYLEQYHCREQAAATPVRIDGEVAQ